MELIECTCVDILFIIIYIYINVRTYGGIPITFLNGKKKNLVLLQTELLQNIESIPLHFSLHLVKSRFTGFAYVTPMLFRNEFNGFQRRGVIVLFCPQFVRPESRSKRVPVEITRKGGWEEEEREMKFNSTHLAFPSNNFSIKNFTEQWNFPIRGNVESVDALRESRNRSA